MIILSFAAVERYRIHSLQDSAVNREKQNHLIF